MEIHIYLVDRKLPYALSSVDTHTLFAPQPSGKSPSEHLRAPQSTDTQGWTGHQWASRDGHKIQNTNKKYNVKYFTAVVPTLFDLRATFNRFSAIPEISREKYSSIQCADPEISCEK